MSIQACGFSPRFALAAAILAWREDVSRLERGMKSRIETRPLNSPTTPILYITVHIIRHISSRLNERKGGMILLILVPVKEARREGERGKVLWKTMMSNTSEVVCEPQIGINGGKFVMKEIIKKKASATRYRLGSWN